MDLSHRKRIFGLDIFRTLAILPVVIGHGGFILEKSGSNFPWIPLYDGVELFFTLSGYLIGGQLISMFCVGENYGWKNVLSFLTRRWLRTLPNYYLVLILNILFIYYGVVNGNLEKATWRFFFFLQNFDIGFTDFFWESWSLSIEEWFYLLFPFFYMGDGTDLSKIKSQDGFSDWNTRFYSCSVTAKIPDVFQYAQPE